MTDTVPRRPGTAVFTGGGWLLGGAGEAPRDGSPGRTPGDEVLVLSDPCRVLVAEQAGEISALLAEIGAEQARGRHVAGYLAYEAGAAFGLTVRPSDSLPLAWMAVYPDSSVRRLSTEERGSLLSAVDTRRVGEMLSSTQLSLNVSRQDFARAIQRIKELIAAGDTYQVNYTVRARFDLAVDPFDYFLALLLRQPVPFAAFLDLGRAQVLSLSPELFLRRQGNLVESMPMKGTRPRGDVPREDTALAEELILSVKDRAENLMIVDMVRNDLGRVSRAGSVEVPALFSVEPYRTVWQMASTVTGKVRGGATPGEIIAATFPGASITGAPKHHTMEIISSLETEPRGVYTGTVGLFLPGADFTGNLAIRTLVHQRGSFRLGVGAGIVWDSDPEEEYQETLTKASFALPSTGGRWEPVPAAERIGIGAIGLFETLLLMEAAGADSGSNARGIARFRYLEEHLDRIAFSAAQLGIAFDRCAAEQELESVASGTAGSAVVRLHLDRFGGLSVTTRAAAASVADSISVLMSPFRTDPHDPLLPHKTTARGLYDRERERAHACGCQEALFQNYLGHVTEGAITNVFVRCNGTWMTPPVEDGLLPGIWRADFSREVGAVERSLTLRELLAADEVVVGNSVRGAMRVGSVVVNCLEGITS